MRAFNFGAVRRALYASAVLTLLSVPSLAQIVEKSRTLADLLASHPCNSGLSGRHTIVTDCDAADDLGNGGGAFSCFARCDGVDTWSAVAIGGGAGGGSGDVVGPASATDSDLAIYDSTTGKLLKASGTPRVAGKTLVFGDPAQNGDSRIVVVSNLFKVRTGDDLYYQTLGAGSMTSYRYDASAYVQVNGDLQSIIPSTGNLEVSGSLDIADPGTRPTCDSSKRGRFFVDEGGAGVADTVAVCTKDAADSYAWHDLY